MKSILLLRMLIVGLLSLAFGVIFSATLAFPHDAFGQTDGSCQPDEVVFSFKVKSNSDGVFLQKAYVQIVINDTSSPTYSDYSREKGLATIFIPDFYMNRPADILVEAAGHQSFSQTMTLTKGQSLQTISLLAVTSTITTTSVITVSPEPASTPTLPPPSSTATSSPPPTTASTPATPTNTPMPTPSRPQGQLAIPLNFGMGHKVYITGLDGKGINTNPISVDARQPVFSPDGASIMVNGRVNGVLGLFQLTSSGFSPEIVINRESAAWPVLSPDGSEVLFVETTLGYRLHRRYSDEGDDKIEEIRLNGRPIFAKNLLWTEDNRLVFQGCAVWLDRDGDCGTWVTDASNLAPKKLIDGNGDWPMNAKRGLLAYQTAADGDWEIYVMPLDGSKEGVNVTNNDAQDGLPAISPDGKYVAYISNQSGAWAVWTVDLNSLTKTKLFDINSERGTVTPETWTEERMSWAW